MLYCRINEPFEWSCFWAGNGTVLPSRVGSTSRRGEFCFGCQQGPQINEFFCILVLLFTVAANSENQVQLPAGPFPTIPVS